jgi:hypothetical protein
MTKINFYFLILVINTTIIAQSGFVDIDHKVYNFFDRMTTLGFLDDYNSFEIPKSSKEIKKNLLNILKNKEKLNYTDNKILEDLVFEFDYLINGTDSTYSSIIGEKAIFDSFNFDTNKSLYFYTDSLKNGFFINLLAENNTIIKKDKKANIFIFGGELHGYLWDELGFYLRGTNGFYKGDKNTALNFGSLRYNYKANLNPNYQGANSYFDETEGYIYFNKNNYGFKLGRDRIILGHGIVKPFIGKNAPPIDYFSLNINYSIFNFSYLHGKLLSNPTIRSDSLVGEIHDLVDKYIVYHRFELNFSKHLKVGLGEFIIYGNRSLDLSYLNPFNFYKSIEHINQDRDNSYLFIDISNNSFAGFSPYLTIFVDDIDFGKIGKKWYGNQLLWDTGINISLFPNTISGLLKFQYLRIEPYVFTHRIPYNNFTSLNYLLNDNIEPNSQLFNIKFLYFPNKRLDLSVTLSYKEHGENIYDNNGNLLTNYGGSTKFGHRPNDKEYVSFLDGRLVKSSNVVFEGNYEFVRNNFLGILFSLLKEDIGNQNKADSFLLVNLKLKL